MTTLVEELERAAEMFEMIAVKAKAATDKVPAALSGEFARRLRQRAAWVREKLAECTMSECCDCFDVRALTGPIPSETAVWTEKEIARAKILADGYRDIFPDPETAPAAPKPDEWLEQAAKYVEALAGFQSEDDIATDLHRFAAHLRARTSGERIACLNCRSTVPFDSKAETWCMRCGFKLSHRFERPAAPKEGTVKLGTCPEWCAKGKCELTAGHEGDFHQTRRGDYVWSVRVGGATAGEAKPTGCQVQGCGRHVGDCPHGAGNR